MTPEEAIKTIQVAVAEVEWNYPLDYAIAFETAINALEKQIPKKPLYSLHEYGQRYICYKKQEFYKCPTCNNVIYIQNHIGGRDEKGYVTHRYPQGSKTKCCNDCGQALDWSDIER